MIQSQVLLSPWLFSGHLGSHTQAPTLSAHYKSRQDRTIYAGYNSQNLIFPPMQNYSQFSLFLTVVGSLSQNAFPRLYLSSVIRRQYELVETFCTSAFQQSKCERGCQALRLSCGSFSRTIICCLFFIYSVTTTQWRQQPPHPAGEH